MDGTIFCIHRSGDHLLAEDRTMRSTFKPRSGERVCVSLFSWLAVSLLPGNIMRL